TLDRRTQEDWKTASNNTSTHKLTWQYDDLDRVTREADNNGTTNTTSDDLVNTFAYDGLGRLKDETNYDSSTTGQPLVHETYGYGFEYLVSSFYDRVTRNQFLHAGTTDTGVAKTVSTFDRLGQLQFFDDQDNAA